MNVATSQMLLLALPKGCINKDTCDDSCDTMKCLWDILAWSWQAVFYNKWPTKDHLGKDWPKSSARAANAGQPLSKQGHHGLLYAVQADMEYFHNEFHLPGPSHEHICWNCSANKSSGPYNDWKDGALWRGTVVSHAGHCPTEHPISTIPGIVGESFKFDCLHVIELGLAASIIANISFDFVCRPGWVGSQEQRLQKLFEKICTQYEELAIISSDRVGRWPFSCFCNIKQKWKHFPSLPGIKARHVRRLVPVFLNIAEEFKDPAGPYTVHRYKCIRKLNTLYALLDSAGMHPSVSDAKAFKKAMDTCLLHYNRLSVLCIEQNLLMWNTIPKFHYSAHMGEAFRWLNPKYYSCYAGETMVGHVAALAHSTLNGTPAWLVASKACWRFRLAFHLQTQGAEFDVTEVDSD